jgi:hypothetical protein
LPDVNVIDNPDYNAEDVFSSKYLLHDITDIEISLNPEYVGEWLVYGKVKKVAFPSNEIDGQLLYDFFIQNGDINSDGEVEFMNWRGIRFLDTGIVETNSGNQVLDYTQSDFWGSIWSDGWIISETEQTRAHAIIYKGDETLLFFELKNGDYFRGRAPTYMVFKKQ